MITWDDFAKIDFRIGTIVSVDDFPEARRPAYKISVDFGPEIGIKKSSAQVKDLYSKEELLGKQVLCVVNFPPKQIGPVLSEVLITGFRGPDGVALALSDKPVPNGTQLS